jgi:hypothetical protein
MPWEDGPLSQEHRQACNALDRPPRIGTFDFEHKGVAAIKLGEQYFQDPAVANRSGSCRGKFRHLLRHSARRSKGRWRKTALIIRLAEQHRENVHSLHGQCSKLRRQFWRRLRRPRICRRRLR